MQLALLDGTSPFHDPWYARAGTVTNGDARWIDRADYNQLLDKLTPYPDPAVIYVSGMIAADGRTYLGPLYQFNEGIPDRNETSREGLYGLAVNDELHVRETPPIRITILGGERLP